MYTFILGLYTFVIYLYNNNKPNNMNHMLTELNNDDSEKLNDAPEMDECELCLNPIPFNSRTYKFASTQFNKQVKCGCYDCYIFELENKL